MTRHRLETKADAGAERGRLERRRSALVHADDTTDDHARRRALGARLTVAVASSTARRAKSAWHSSTDRPRIKLGVGAFAPDRRHQDQAACENFLASIPNPRSAVPMRTTELGSGVAGST